MPFKKKFISIDVGQHIVTEPDYYGRAEGDPLLLGIRPSPQDGRPTTSTGTNSLDHIVAGSHAGLPLGTCLLIEETGTSDFAGILCRYFAAEGLVQGHHVHVVGQDNGWEEELPALSDHVEAPAPSTEQMKIAWRYETLITNRRHQGGLIDGKSVSDRSTLFCHKFDLATSLNKKDIRGQTYRYPLSSTHRDLDIFIGKLTAELKSSSSQSIHRVAVPNLLSPAIFNSYVCYPQRAIGFLHNLRALLQQYPTKLVVMITISTTLFPGRSGIARWLELLCDAAIELATLPHQGIRTDAGTDTGSAGTIHGFLSMKKLPVYQETGATSMNVKISHDNFSFRTSVSRGVEIVPCSLPPIVDDIEDSNNFSLGINQPGSTLEF